MMVAAAAGREVPRILAVGAYERDNFGDLLYLEIMRLYTRGNFDVQFAAPIKAEMSRDFEHFIPAAAPILASDAVDAVWTVGGEVVSASLEYAYRTAYGDDKFNELMAVPRSARLEQLREATEGIVYDSPYIMRPSTFSDPRTALVVNSIGAAGIENFTGSRKEVLAATLKEAAFISVRDQGSHEVLEKMAIPHLLAPDLAHTLPLIHPAAQLDERSTYALVQLPEFAIREHGLESWIEALSSSEVLSNLSVRFFLAGLAPGHDSLHTAHRARDLLAEATGGLVSVSQARGVWPRVDEIAQAALWIGGSLHGRVVAASYGVPRVSLHSWKVDQYAETWDAGSPFGATPDSLVRDIRTAYTGVDSGDPTELARQAEGSIFQALAMVRHWRSSSACHEQPTRLLGHRVAEAQALSALVLDSEETVAALRNTKSELVREIGRLREDRDRLRDEASNLRVDRDRWKQEAEQLRLDRAHRKPIDEAD